MLFRHIFCKHIIYRSCHQFINVNPCPRQQMTPSPKLTRMAGFRGWVRLTLRQNPVKESVMCFYLRPSLWDDLIDN